MRTTLRFSSIPLVLATLAGCSGGASSTDASTAVTDTAMPTDSPLSPQDSPAVDTGPTDAGAPADTGDAGAFDAGPATMGQGFGTGCIPIASSMRVCADAGLAYAYVCANNQQPPESGCATGFGAGRNIVCCPNPLCVRDDGSDYQCGVDERHPTRPPSAFLCYDNAPADLRRCTTGTGAAASLSGSPTQSTRVCCP